MAGEEEGPSGDKPRGIHDDLAEMLEKADPADGDKILAEWRERRNRQYNYAVAARLSEEAWQLMHKLSDEESDKEGDDLGCVIDYFRAYNPEPLLSRLMYGPPLSREGQLWLAQALAEIATERGGQYEKVLRDIPNPVGRPRKKPLGSDEMILWANRVREAKETEIKKRNAVKKVAEEYGISQTELWSILRHEKWARDFYARSVTRID